MSSQNYTDISHLAKKKQPISYGPIETEKPLKTVELKDVNDVEIHEVVEHKPDAEAKEYIQAHKESIKVSKDLKKIGVRADQTTKFPTYQKVKLPISDEKVVAGLKAPITSSLRWLSEFCVFLLRKAHLRLKIAHGKATRMFQK